MKQNAASPFQAQARGHGSCAAGCVRHQRQHPPQLASPRRSPSASERRAVPYPRTPRPAQSPRSARPPPRGKGFVGTGVFGTNNG